jgi:hypothetical protein
MTGLILAAMLAAQAQPATAPGTELRALTAAVLDDKGRPLTGLAPSDVALVENGVARDLVSFKPDARPLSLAVVLDSSAALDSSFRLVLLDAVAGFVARLPEGSRYALWTTGDRPTKVADWSDDRLAAAEPLKRVVPRGGNRLLDALPEAAGDLERLAAEGSRRVLLAISSDGPELSDLDRVRAVEATQGAADLVLAVEIDLGDSESRARAGFDLQDGFETRARIAFVLGRLAAGSGGAHEVTLSAMGCEPALRKLEAVLRGGYRLVYATSTGIEKRKIELRVARPRARALLPAVSRPVR